MNSQNEEINNLIVPCLLDGKLLFNFVVKYVTRGNQLLRIDSYNFEDPQQVSRFDRRIILEGVTDTLAIMGHKVIMHIDNMKGLLMKIKS